MSNWQEATFRTVHRRDARDPSLTQWAAIVGACSLSQVVFESAEKVSDPQIGHIIAHSDTPAQMGTLPDTVTNPYCINYLVGAGSPNRSERPSCFLQLTGAQVAASDNWNALYSPRDNRMK